MYGYLIFISSFGVIIFAIMLIPQFDKPQFLKLKGGLFLLFGISAGIAIVQFDFFPDSIGSFPNLPSLLTFYLGGLFYIVGAVIYILRIPERFKPGLFDYIGNSHNIFHLFVLLGVACHYDGCIKSYNYRLNNTCLP